MKTAKLVENKATGLYLSEDQAREVDALMATLPKDTAYAPRQKMLSDVTDINQTERTDIATISTDDVDSHADVVVQSGLSFEIFDTNPLVLYQHDPERIVGKCLWHKTTGGKTIAKTLYPTKPEKYDGEW